MWGLPMKIASLVAVGIVVACSSVVCAEQFVYEGPWNTTNRKLAGEMTCVVTPLASTTWQGHFQGTWQNVPFDYTVSFTGPAKDLHGTATIDGAAYEWRGWITSQQFKGSFGGDRYAGTFELQRRERPPRLSRKSDSVHAYSARK